jgi:acyl-CoA thioesterase FadM
MSLWFRLLQVVEATLSRTRLGPLEEARIEMRTWPTDFDWTGHVGDERYLELMKLGRYVLASRQGILGEMNKKGVTAHVGAAEVQYLDELNLFECFAVLSRVVAWDDKWVYVEQSMERCGGRKLAVGRAQLVFKHDGETVPPELVMSWSGQRTPSPPIPEEFRRLRVNRPCDAPRCSMRFTEDDLPGLGSVSALAGHGTT